MTQIDTVPPVKRGRGRPRKVQPSAPTGGFPGPSLDSILRLSDQQVVIQLEALGEEPRPFRWVEGDDTHNQATWGSYGTLDFTGPPLPIAELHTTARAIHNANLRMQLAAAYLRQWVDGLEDSQLVAEIERLTSTKFSVSESRYAKRTDLQQRVMEQAWPVLVAQSTMYQPPQNPLEGVK